MMKNRLNIFLALGTSVLQALIQVMSGDQTTEPPINYYPTNCKLTKGGHEYAGSLSITVNNRTCQAWNISEPHHNYYIDATNAFPDGNSTAAGNQCRNPTPDWHKGVWCYTTDPNQRWEACNVNFCECKLLSDAEGRMYQGQTTITTSGRTCQRWSRRYPHSHNYTRDNLFPDGSVAEALNYCRNPNASRPEGPWCYTIDPAVEWEYCHIPVCYLSIPTTSAATPSLLPTSPSSSTTKPASSSPTAPFHWPDPISSPTVQPLVWNSDIPKDVVETSSSSNVGMIVGILGGVCFVLFIAVGLIILCKRRPDIVIRMRNKLNGLSTNPANKIVNFSGTAAENNTSINGNIEQPPLAAAAAAVAAESGTSGRNKQPSFDNPIYDQPRVNSPSVSLSDMEKDAEAKSSSPAGRERITIAGDTKVSFLSMGNVDFA